MISFADEEGARFNTPTFGARALAGSLDVADVLDRRDDDGVALADAMRAAGVDPGRRRATRRRGSSGCAASSSCTSTRRRDLDAPVRRSVRRRLAARLRLQAELHGRADHAGHDAAATSAATRCCAPRG